MPQYAAMIDLATGDEGPYGYPRPFAVTLLDADGDDDLDLLLASSHSGGDFVPSLLLFNDGNREIECLR